MTTFVGQRVLSNESRLERVLLLAAWPVFFVRSDAYIRKLYDHRIVVGDLLEHS